MIQEIKDEVIEGSPRYNVTDNEDGTKNIELANDVIQAGTPLNKATFNNLQGDLYTSDRYNKLEVHRKMVPVDYATDLIYSEENHIGDCIPKTWVATDDTNLTFTSEDGTKLYASSKDGSYTPDKACDGDLNTFWHADTYGSDQHLTIEFTNPIRIKKMKVSARLYSPSWSVEFYISGSNDKQNWKDLASTLTPTSSTPSLKEVNITDVTPYKYFRFATAVYGKQTCVIHELQVTEYSTNVVYGEYEYYSDLNLPLASYEEGKIVNVECGKFVDETIQGNIVPTRGWETNTPNISINSNGIKISSTSSGDDLWKICDGDISSYFRPSSSTTRLVITYKFPYNVKISKMILKQSGVENATITISGSNDNANFAELFSDSGEYLVTRECSFTGELGYYKYYKLDISSSESDIAYIYVWQPSEIQGVIYETFPNYYININNNGAKQVKGKIKYGLPYNLIYKNGVWNILGNLIFGTYGSTSSNAQSAKITLGLKPKYVLLFSENNMSSSIGVSTSGSVMPKSVPRIICDLSSGDSLNDDGFTVALSSTGSSSITHLFYYIAIC